MSSQSYNWKHMKPVPTATQFIDTVLTRTQRKTPTVVRKGWKIQRIRSFYMRKIRFTQQTFHERLTLILDDFPKLDELHPFFADLLNVLYSRDHYKIALGQINFARQTVDNIAKDYLRMIKYGDSLYRCKQLKRAALGRMCTMVKKLNASLGYLEEVRQHLSRLPAIDPTARTLLITGYPNVGKSSFINKVTNAKVEVQDYAFTTKSIHVGHVDHDLLRYQVLDTPGILDHPLDDRNTIEMQAITALAHLHSCVMFFIDISEQCGYSIEQQVALYHSIKPLFSNKPILIVTTKIDLRKWEEVLPEQRALIEQIATERNTRIVQMSNISEEGINQVKSLACSLILQERVQRKIRNVNKVESVRNRIQVAQPVRRDSKPRPAAIPASVQQARQEAAAAEAHPGEAAMEVDEVAGRARRKLQREREAEQGGPGVYSVDTREGWQLRRPEWKYDQIPEIMNGRNIADWVDPNIDKNLQQLMREEAELAARGDDMDVDDDGEFDIDEDEWQTYQAILRKKHSIMTQNRLRQANNSATLPRTARARAITLNDVDDHLSSLGLDTARMANRARSKKRKADVISGRSRSQSRAAAAAFESRMPGISGMRAMDAALPRQDLMEVRQRRKARKLANKAQIPIRMESRSGEADRRHYDMMPKHLNTGKRGIGSNDRR